MQRDRPALSRPRLLVRRLGLRPYESTWRAMRAFTDARTPAVASEIWLLEHPPVFTQGQAGRAEHLLDPVGLERGAPHVSAKAYEPRIGHTMLFDTTGGDVVTGSDDGVLYALDHLGMGAVGDGLLTTAAPWAAS